MSQGSPPRMKMESYFQESIREYMWLPVHTDPVLRQQMEARITHLLTPALQAPPSDKTLVKSAPAEAKEDKSDAVPKAA